MCIAVWNSGVRCDNHVFQSAKFVTLLPTALEANLGITSGRVLSGNVSGIRRHHVTVAAACVELSVLLAESAAKRSLPFLATGAVGIQLEREDHAAVLESWHQVEALDHNEAAAPAGSAPAGCEFEVWGPKAERRESFTLQDVKDVDPATTVRYFVGSFRSVEGRLSIFGRQSTTKIG
eukprot:Hpha_TRINITY_DN16844_c2_g1::TRINITY_DN16844_c2_g1_i3::g.152647::m.152647